MTSQKFERPIADKPKIENEKDLIYNPKINN